MKIIKSKNWTDFNNSTKEIFSEGCMRFAEEFKDYNFKYLKSKNWVVREDNKMILVISIGTNRYNEKNKTINFNTRCEVYSEVFKEFNSYYKNFEGMTIKQQQDQLVTFFQTGNIIPTPKYKSWNLKIDNPIDIARIHIEYALPSLMKFTNQSELINELLEKGQSEEFTFEFQVLDYLMCFGDENIAKKGLNKLLENRNLYNRFEYFMNKLKNRERISDKEKDLKYLLAERVFKYKLN